MHRKFFRLILSCVLLLAAAATASAQQPMPLAEADLRFQALYEQSNTGAMVLVVVRNHEVLVKTYGEAFPGSGHPPDSNSLIRLCSVSKIFATDLLARLAAEGKVSLDDPLQSYAPRGKVVPLGVGGTQITLRDLATHTAGLPREVSAYPPKTPHFTFPSYALRWSWLPKQKLISPPGTAALYSNVGYDFLGDALASATHESYARLLHDRLLQPLGMWDTTLVPSSEQCARLLRGTGKEGECTDTQPSGASGGIYSTASDMVKFLQYLLHISGSQAQPATALAVFLRPQQLKSIQGLSHAGDPTGIGLGWIQIGDPNSPSMVMEKTGGGGGFTTYIALNSKRQTGIFVAATERKGGSHIDLFNEGNDLLAALANVPPLPPKVHVARATRSRAKAQRRRKTARPSSHLVR